MYGYRAQFRVTRYNLLRLAKGIVHMSNMFPFAWTISRVFIPLSIPIEGNRSISHLSIPREEQCNRYAFGISCFPKKDTFIVLYSLICSTRS